jgi:uncharacterized protein YaeQ
MSMALGASIYKVQVSLSNLNSHLYEDFSLTMAKHPSENEERMMYRLLAFLLCADPALEFTKGLSTTEEPELWVRDYSGDIVHWIELGMPELKRLRQACGKSQRVSVFTYQNIERVSEWFSKIKSECDSLKKLEIYQLNIIENGSLEALVERTMKLSCLIQDDQIDLSSDKARILCHFSRLT